MLYSMRRTLIFESRLLEMENWVSRSAVLCAQDSHFREDAPRNGNVTSKALDAYSLKRIKVCNCGYRDPGIHCLLCEYNNSDRPLPSHGEPLRSPLPARAPPVVVRTGVVASQTPSNYVVACYSICIAFCCMFMLVLLHCCTIV